MAKGKSTSTETEIGDILKVTTGQFDCYVLGSSPLVLNRMSEKVRHELLMPKGRKTAVEKATTLKHDPIEEFNAAPHTLKDPKAPTFLAILATAFKGALRSAALDMPGAKKSQIGRLTFIQDEYVSVYGIPKLFMMPVRSADMNKTPDIRTRVIVPKWACHVTITFVQPLIRAQALANLLAAAGLTIGVGDGRPEKGALSYGQFTIVGRDDKHFADIVKTGGRAAQIAAMKDPTCYDDETTELLSWFQTERQRRQLKGVA